MRPRTKYGLDLIARSHRRTLASIAEWPCIESMKTQQLTSPHGNERPVEHVLEELWDPHEPDRFVKLALHDPSLIDYQESLIWKVIDEEPSFWERTDKPGVDERNAGMKAKDGQPIRHPRVPDMKRIREQWDTILLAADAAIDRDNATLSDCLSTISKGE